MPKGIRVTPEMILQIRAEHKAGVKILDLAKRFKLGTTAVRRALHAKLHAPSGINTTAYANGSAELADIQARIAELKARAKDLRSRSSKRQRLLGYCTRHGYTRADLFAVAGQMPMLRVSRKSREARASGTK